MLIHNIFKCQYMLTNCIKNSIIAKCMNMKYYFVFFLKSSHSHALKYVQFIPQFSKKLCKLNNWKCFINFRNELEILFNLYQCNFWSASVVWSFVIKSLCIFITNTIHFFINFICNFVVFFLLNSMFCELDFFSLEIKCRFYVWFF